MSLKIRSASAEIEFSPSSQKIMDDYADHVTLKSASGKEIEVKGPFPLFVNKDRTPQDYAVYILYDNSPKENEIFQVHENGLGTRIGWIFPLQSILSKEHEYGKNDHFKEYANTAIIKLLNDEIETSKTNVPTSNTEDKYHIFDFYPENAVILIIDKTKMLDFKLDNYLVSLYLHGYSKNSDTRKIDSHPSKLGRKKITIKPICELIRGDRFLDLLLFEISKVDLDPLLKFHLLYQIIEIFIEDIYKGEIQYYLDNIETIKHKDPHELRDELFDVINESKRIAKLFRGINGLTDLRKACKDFLGTELENSSPHNYLYKVRCFLVHNYHKINAEQFEVLNSINICLEEVVLRLVLEYSGRSAT